MKQIDWILPTTLGVHIILMEGPGTSRADNKEDEQVNTERERERERRSYDVAFANQD